MAAAIGLSLYLDKLGKRATAIYSGATPNALQFLKPDETFEDTADVLQDFVIALNKEKADHLRYKMDGDYVKIYITPYLSRISEEDLEFSYGDFNVDLVIALDVANGVDLDDALREHGRIMHDATIVNITTSNPGKLGEIEWSDKKASSVSEMIAKLIYGMGARADMGKEEATAFLTGIVAATNRFSGANTTPDTMTMASKLMRSGANQQLVARNITPDMDNELFGLGASEVVDNDATKLDIGHGNEGEVDETKEVETVVNEQESTLLDDLKAAEASLAAAGAEVTPEVKEEPLEINDEAAPAEKAEVSASGGTPAEPKDESVAADEGIIDKPETVIQPSAGFANTDEGDKYGQMLEAALAENPATTAAPVVPTTPEINGVPEMNYMPMPDNEVLPPPPTPPIDFGAPVVPATPVVEPVESLSPQPAMQDQVYNAAANDPGAFQIPTAQ